MKKFIKSISTYVAVALVSIGATYGMYSYMDSKRDNSSTNYNNHGGTFKQENVHFASLTSDGYPDFTKAAESSIHAVVHIKSTVKGSPQSRRQIDPFEYFFGPGQGREYQYEPQPRVGFGSGVIISKDGYIITNNHVIDKATEIEVSLNDNRKLNAKLVGTDPQTDIALLKVEGDDLPYIPFGNSDQLKVGEWVLAVGNPFNLTSTVTAGIVSAKGRGGIGNAPEDIQSYIQTDAAINQGNSGGALVNTNGELVGINTAIYSRTGDFAGAGFAVPISIAGKVVADIKEYGTVQRAILGVSVIELSKAKELASSGEKGFEGAEKIKIEVGAYIGGLSEESAAKQAGLKAGDVITAVNGVKIKNGSELQEQISRFNPGDKVKVTINRDNSEKTFDITLKNTSGNTSIVKKTDVMSNLGVVFKELTDEQKKQHGISSGVYVAGVENGGAFAKSGLTKGYIILRMNGESVSTPGQAESIIQSAAKSPDKSLFLSTLTPTGQRKLFAIELE
ncbi:Do family serine endopeptidase [Dysgonomonas sp. Marseille-P4361]|uniref:Do family serine endopeptidase n=1 Tax=Dysgonomonas sp. Marseille-P4361 TaxID=2161820 RepID=UPI000D54EFC5|nr:Do family serine endopeptidase [Dysgonomonas sp. Marseille-P4361]